MKKLVKVTIEKEIEIEIPDEMLTEEAIKEFCEHFYADMDSEDAIIKYAAQYVAQFDRSFVEGIGNVSYTELDETVETEIL